MLGTLSLLKDNLFRTDPVPKRKIEQHIDSMLNIGIIEPSNSPWSSSIFLTKKADGSDRFICDFRGVNSVTRKDAYPSVRFDECIDAHRWGSLFLINGSSERVLAGASRPCKQTSY